MGCIDGDGENVSLPRLMSDDLNAIGILSPLVGYHLRRAFGAFLLDFADTMDGTGMRQVLVGVLAVVSREPGINQGAAGRLLGISRANMVSLINELVEAGLIDRSVDSEDRRAFALNVTAKGQKKLDDCLRRIEAHESRMLAGFSPEEKDMLIRLLSRVERRSRVVVQPVGATN